MLSGHRLLLAAVSEGGEAFEPFGAAEPARGVRAGNDEGGSVTGSAHCDVEPLAVDRVAAENERCIDGRSLCGVTGRCVAVDDRRPVISGCLVEVAPAEEEPASVGE